VRKNWGFLIAPELSTPSVHANTTGHAALVALLRDKFLR